MKSLVILLFAASCVFSEELDLPADFEADPARPQDALLLSANRKYSKEKEAVRAKYRERLASVLEHADAIEICRLDFDTIAKIPDGQDQAFFPIKPYDCFSRILARKVLAGEDLLNCRTAMVELLKAPSAGEGAWCHYPIHGIQFLRKGEVLFQSSFCWKCCNFYVAYPDDDRASWVGIAADGLKDLLMEQLPIPQSELDRFDRDQGRREPADEEKK